MNHFCLEGACQDSGTRNQLDRTARDNSLFDSDQIWICNLYFCVLHCTGQIVLFDAVFGVWWWHIQLAAKTTQSLETTCSHHSAEETELRINFVVENFPNCHSNSRSTPLPAKSCHVIISVRILSLNSHFAVRKPLLKLWNKASIPIC